MVPYGRSVEWVKEQCAVRQQPVCTTKRAESAIPCATWEQAPCAAVASHRLRRTIRRGQMPSMHTHTHVPHAHVDVSARRPVRRVRLRAASRHVGRSGHASGYSPIVDMPRAKLVRPRFAILWAGEFETIGTLNASADLPRPSWTHWKLFSSFRAGGWQAGKWSI